MDKCKAKAIQVDLGTFRNIQAYSELCVTLTYLKPWYIQNPNRGIFRTIYRTRSIFRTLAYSQLWYIQNPGTFRTLAYSKSEAYSEPCQAPTMKRFLRVVNGYNYFIITFSKLAPFPTLWNKYLEVVSTEAVSYSMQKTMAREGIGDHEFLIFLLIYSSKLAYLQLITVWFIEAVLPKVINKVT